MLQSIYIQVSFFCVCVQSVFTAIQAYEQLPSQEEIYRQGNEYLQANFPKLDYIKKATYSLKAPRQESSSLTQTLGICFAVFVLVTVVALIALSLRYSPSASSTIILPQSEEEQTTPLTEIKPRDDAVQEDIP